MLQDVVKAGYEALMKRRVVWGTQYDEQSSRGVTAHSVRRAQASLNEAFCKKVPLEDQKRERGSSKRPLRQSAERVRLLL
jgi:hypothetical protein